MNIKSKVEPLIWKERKLYLLDQRVIPYEKKYLELTSYKEVINAIKDMVLRGAPLIGITAVYGFLLGAYEEKKSSEEIEKFKTKLKSIGEEIKSSRPTAINLNWAVDLLLEKINNINNIDQIISKIEELALWIHEDDKKRCENIGKHGNTLVKNGDNILTICNTGALATGGIGTAFGVIQTAHESGKNITVYACETRPRQQGARLTMYELKENNIKCTLVPDTACGYLMKNIDISMVITGADRIAKNGDTANKIGTYQLSILAKEHNIPFYVAAPLSTFDLSIHTGEDIPIEERHENEVLKINGKLICPENSSAFNPAFDVTPSKHISGIITERGILKSDYLESIEKMFSNVFV